MTSTGFFCGKCKGTFPFNDETEDHEACPLGGPHTFDIIYHNHEEQRR